MDSTGNDPLAMKLYVPQRRKYMEVTLHMSRGSKVVFACKEYTVKRNRITGRYEHMEWTNSDFADLPRLSDVDLDRVEAITSRTIEDIK